MYSEKKAAADAMHATRIEPANGVSPDTGVYVHLVSPVTSQAHAAATDARPSNGTHTHGRPPACNPAARPAHKPSTMPTAFRARRIAESDGADCADCDSALETAAGRKRNSATVIAARDNAHITSSKVVLRCA